MSNTSSGWQATIGRPDGTPVQNLVEASAIAATFGWTIDEEIHPEFGIWLVTIPRVDEKVLEDENEGYIEKNTTAGKGTIELS